MTSITITITSDTLTQALRDLERRALDPRPAFADMGEYLLRETRGRFDNETDPQGTPWAELAPSTIKSKQRRQKGDKTKAGKARARVKAPPTAILRETNTLRDTITYQATSDSLRLGTPQQYGVFPQFGTRKMPKREFLGVGGADAQELLAILEDFLRNP
jgi:phage virion morphogenesis protein